MTVAEVKSMTLEQKLQIMEAIWEDMREHFEQTPIPDEHKALLDKRRADVAIGAAKLLDWDLVKGSIGRQ